MKKSVSIILVTILVFGIVLASAPLQVQAKPLESVTPNPLIAGGSWTSGSEADVAALVGSAPTWLQWLANGVKVTEAGKICHPLRGGQFGWVGQIMQYKNGQWVKLATTNDWVPNKEGEFMACAQAPAAGTYALFGYWIRPAGYVEGTQAPVVVDCDTLEWYVSSDSYTFVGSVANVPANTEVVVSIEFVFPEGTVITANSSTTTEDLAGNFTLSPTYSELPSILSAIFTLPAYGCTYSKFFEY